MKPFKANLSSVMITLHAVPVHPGASHDYEADREAFYRRETVRKALHALEQLVRVIKKDDGSTLYHLKLTLLTVPNAPAPTGATPVVVFEDYGQLKAIN